MNQNKPISVLLICSLVLSNISGALAADAAPVIPSMPKTSHRGFAPAPQNAPTANTLPADISSVIRVKLKQKSPSKKSKAAADAKAATPTKPKELFPLMPAFWVPSKVNVNGKSINPTFEEIRQRLVEYYLFVFDPNAFDSQGKCLVSIYHSDARTEENKVEPVMLRMRPGAREAAEKAAINDAAKSRGCDQANDPTCPGYANLENAEAPASEVVPSETPDEATVTSDAASAASNIADAAGADDASPYILCDIEKDKACIGDYFIEDFGMQGSGATNLISTLLHDQNKTCLTAWEWKHSLAELKMTVDLLWDELLHSPKGSQMPGSDVPRIASSAMAAIVLVGLGFLAYQFRYKTLSGPGPWAADVELALPGHGSLKIWVHELVTKVADVLVRVHTFKGMEGAGFANYITWFMGLLFDLGVVTGTYYKTDTLLNQVFVETEMKERIRLSDIFGKTGCRAMNVDGVDQLSNPDDIACDAPPSFDPKAYRVPRLIKTDLAKWEETKQALSHFITRFLQLEKVEK